MPAVRHPKYFALVLTMLAGMIWASGCGDGATEPPAPTPDPPRPTTVTVTPATAELAALGATVQLTVEVLDQNGRAMAGATVTWASSATAVATTDANGLVTAEGNGTATITATAGSASGSAAVTVAQEVSAVAVSPAADTLVEGDTLRFSAEAADANGHSVDGAGLQWASSDTAVAVVDDSGLATGVSAGGAQITATASGVAGGAALTIEAPVPAAVEVTPDTVEFTALGEAEQLAAEVRDQIGRGLTATVLWSSGDTLVAAVDSAGRVTAVGSGTTVIAATAGEARGEAVVSVMQAAGSVVVSPSADTIAPGDTLRTAAEAFDENGHRVDGAAFTWSSTNGSVARVDDTGLVEGVAEGTATITATAGAASGVAEITVENPDRAALVALYNATDGPNWLDNTNWLSDAPLGDWHGVETDVSGRVTGLDLSSRWDEGRQRHVLHGLYGPIPAELGNLASLERLHLSVNALSGAIPPELGGLGNLRELDLVGNRLAGPIPPELGGLGNLRELHLADNRLTGPIPRDIGNLVSLEWLTLGRNDLTGSIPAEIGGLANLQSLQLQYNNLTGPIPSQLGGLAKLDDLFLEGNALTGSVPSELGNLAALWWLGLSDNALSGPLPASLTDLARLGNITFDRNDGLCAPGTTDFVSWLQGIRTRRGPLCNEADVVVLESLYEAAGGSGWTESDGWLGDEAVEEWHGVTVDSLGRVTALNMARNGLKGGLPSNLGNLAAMTRLLIGENALSGRLPSSLSRLSLVEFHYTDTELCAPAHASFRTWLAGIPSHEGTGEECAPLTEREILEILYWATDGPNWTQNDHWLSDEPPGDWYGVSVDDDGRVVRLWLPENNLTGPIPAELGDLVNLRLLGLWSNNLTGPIPQEVGNLVDLQELLLGGNQLTGPIPVEFGNLTNLRRLGLSFNERMGQIPAEFGNLVNLTTLNAQVTGLSGPIPPELGKLTSLQHLRLGYGDNALTGAIPPELGGLASLHTLDLRGNDLTGSIPPALGDLSQLESLELTDNNLTGAIPPELGKLTNLKDLWLDQNNLSDRIPPALGRLASVTLVALDHNALTGSVPPLLGNLAAVEELHLDHNDLEGPVPPGFGRMSSLKQLTLTNNPGMAGALPSRLADLHELEGLLAGGTDLCAPADPGFQTWLARVHKRRIAPCVEGDPPMAYLTQAVQSREYPVPFVAGEKALLRVFPIARKATSQGIPAVRARFYRNGREIHVENIPGKSAPIPTEVDESSLSKSANAEIPGQVIQPGLEMVIEVDPNGTLDSSLLVAKRIPETGRLELDVRAMPLFDLTLIPFVWSQNQDSSIVGLVGAMAADPENHELFEDTRTLLPVGELDVTAHDPVLSTSNNAWDLIANTQAIRAMEGGAGHYMGMMADPVTGAGGIGFIANRVSFSLPFSGTIAHELGHNMSLYHAPCGGAGGPDASFPYPDGSIGAWGYDFRNGGTLVRRFRQDLMSYCGPQWISDYHFTNALRYRLFDEGEPAAASSTESLLLWGGVGADSVPYLEPVFVVDAPAALPDSAGEHRITGRADGGRELFSFSFTMPETADGDGSASFAFILPSRPGWEGNLASITLTGAGGSVTLDGDSDLAMAILRDPRNGQVRGFLRDWPPAQVAMDAAGQAGGPGLEVLFSRGIPDASAWRR